MIRDYKGREKAGDGNIYCNKTLVTHHRPYLHNAQGLRLLHLAQNGSEDLIQLLPELGSRPRNQSGDQSAYKGSSELRGPGVQELVDNLHDVPEAAVSLLVPPLSNLLEGDGDVRPQTLATILERRGKEVERSC